MIILVGYISLKDIVIHYYLHLESSRSDPRTTEEGHNVSEMPFAELET